MDLLLYNWCYKPHKRIAIRRNFIMAVSKNEETKLVLFLVALIRNFSIYQTFSMLWKKFKNLTVDNIQSFAEKKRNFYLIFQPTRLLIAKSEVVTASNL